MKQSRRMSLVEAIANVAVGFGVAMATQIGVFPLFGLHASLSQNLAIGAIFTLTSIARSYKAAENLRVENVTRHRESLSRSAERRSKSLWRGEALGEAQTATFAVIARVADELSTKAFGSRAQHASLQFLQFVA